MIKFLLSLVMLFGATQVQASPSEVGSDGSKVMVIDTAISNGTMFPLINELRRMAVSKTTPKSKTVDLVINSPGGSVVVGFEFLSLMSNLQDQGWKFRCSVYHVAASMAYQILNQCDERRALQNSFLLWHRARVFIGGLFGQAMTAPLAATLSEDLAAIDQIIFSQLQSGMGDAGASDEYLSHHFEAETLHVAANLHAAVPKYLSVYSSIPGLLEALQDTKLTRTQAKGSFFDSVRFGEIIYIRDSAE